VVTTGIKYEGPIDCQRGTGKLLTHLEILVVSFFNQAVVRHRPVRTTELAIEPDQLLNVSED